MAKVRREPGPQEMQSLELTLGYLNFSSGTPDPQFLAGLRELFAAAEGPRPAWRQVCDTLDQTLEHAAEQWPAFADVSQARAVLRLLQDSLVPAYLKFHSDLLFHQTEATLLRAFFVGRACEVILAQGGPWDEVDRIVEGALGCLNDYIGYRPVPALETRRHEPYAHEWVRPIPLFVRGAGVEAGPYQLIVTMALEILEATDRHLLEAACFAPEFLDELAVDPRAYDFDHPVNKRPNYHFGQWDPHHIDTQGRYRRFIVQQVTLDGLLDRVRSVPVGERDRALFEAAAVLAGTILMAAGISGSGPATYDSDVTLATLLPVIAGYRDAFYNQLIERCDSVYRDPLVQEAAHLRQPFGGARQHLNAWLARQRASQMQHVHLARLFARMGYAEAAARQAAIVPVASARMTCQMDCRLTTCSQYVDASRLDEAADVVEEIVDLIRRGIECGALVDPWSILGFDAQFSLFPAMENSVYDHRVDQLVELVEQVFELYSRIWGSAAAADQGELCRQVQQRFSSLAEWWRQFAAHEVSAVDAVDPLELYQAAEKVATALNRWHKEGAGSGEIRFWAEHAHRFESPKAYALVIESLLARDDFVTSLALLIGWLSAAEQVPLERGSSSFHQLAQLWLLKLLSRSRSETAAALPESPRHLVRKFFDYMEANAESYWEVPSFALGPGAAGQVSEDVEHPSAADPEEDGDQHLFEAAYEGVVYRDSTDDGIDSELFGFDSSSHDELTRESRRVVERLSFLSTLARLWQLTAVNRGLCIVRPAGDGQESTECQATMRHWISRAVTNYEQLLELLDAVRCHPLNSASVDPQMLLEYDRQRVVKETLLEQIVTTTVDMLVAAQAMLAALAARNDVDNTHVTELARRCGSDVPATVQVMGALLRGDVRAVRRCWSEWRESLEVNTLLYIPLAKGGRPMQVIAARCRQRTLQTLLAWLPRQGLWVETCELIDVARYMEANHPVGAGAVTEFDELFKIGYRALVESLVTSAESWRDPRAERQLVKKLEELTEILLGSWLQHSRTLRLSVLEHLTDDAAWERLVAFVRHYGRDLFTQHFLQLGNLRAILHQGVGNWLQRLTDDSDACEELTLLRELGTGVSPAEVDEHLSLILEAIVENYGEYRDYNSTTTQSDHGEQLYCLLDFLRLRTQYDRVSWHLKPVVLAHEILVRRHHDHAAGLWRRTLMERIGHEADMYQQRLTDLQQKYAMRMPTVADRFAERFVRPMIIDRICALVKPAVDEAHQETPGAAFQLLEKEAEALASEATGIGFDVPVWLLALEEEVNRVCQVAHRHNLRREIIQAVDAVPLSASQVRRQLNQCAGDGEYE